MLEEKKTLISFNYLYIQKNNFNIFAVSVVCGLFVRYDSVLSAISHYEEVGTAPSSQLLHLGNKIFEKKELGDKKTHIKEFKTKLNQLST